MTFIAWFGHLYMCLLVSVSISLTISLLLNAHQYAEAAV